MLIPKKTKVTSMKMKSCIVFPANGFYDLCSKRQNGFHDSCQIEMTQWLIDKAGCAQVGELRRQGRACGRRS